MRAVFLGTPAAAVPSLCALADVADVDLVITRPDRPAGRKRVPMASAVSGAAEQFGFAIAKPSSKAELLDVLAETSVDFGLVVAYGAILTREMLDTMPRGFLNVHFSLLPRWRGAAPVERAIAAGDERTGVTLMKIDEGLDTGPVIGEVATPIEPDETGGSLTARLAFLGAALVDATLPDYLSGRRTPVSQIDAGTTYAGTLGRQDGLLRPTMSARNAERAVRAYSPRPGAWVDTPQGSLGIHRSDLSDARVEAGAIVWSEGTVVAGFADGALALRVVQPEGRGRQHAESWMHGRRGEPTTFSVEPA
ncbi:MAG: methionyl-tRNA formyltransferase [Acidimicrobiia bacterium]|nr:methionyl-tRNA formyltransferase [Acidimicrobiia bacterium]